MEMLIGTCVVFTIIFVAAGIAEFVAKMFGYGVKEDMAIEFLIGEFPGDADETVALVDTCKGVPIPVHTFKSVEAAEDFLKFVDELGQSFGSFRLQRATAQDLEPIWDAWWEKRGKDL